MSTATLSVWDAVAAMINAEPVGPVSGTGRPILGTPRFYRGKVSGTPAPGYIVFGQRSEGEAGFYGRPGQDGVYRFHCWADTADNASRLYAWLKDLLQAARLDLTGHLMWRGASVRWVTDGPDTDNKAHQVVADVTVETLEA